MQIKIKEREAVYNTKESNKQKLHNKTEPKSKTWMNKYRTGYTKFPNFLLRSEAIRNLTLGEMKVLLVIIEQSLGWKKTSHLSIRQIQSLGWNNQVKRSRVSAYLKSLIDKNIVSCVKKPTQNRGGIYMVNESKYK